ncbi:hypothetical protein HQ544_05540, partial [Candidatus Falkowbacteria bacterium]|nr:hypothetical protein [Candidatus Falkowbacteria bacterium]
RPVAAKTGTTNNYRDAWTIGYTPSLVCGVWVGNNDNSEMKLGAAGGTVAAPIWKMYMKTALAQDPVENFLAPRPVQTNKPMLDGQLTGEVVLEVDKVTGKLATKDTPKNLIEEKTFNELHSLLHYVIKDNPQGGIPSNPASDSYYEPWEQAIRDWVAREKEKAQNPETLKQGETPFDFSAFNLPPVDYDDAHLPENQPTIAFLTPSPSQTITTALLNATVSAFSPRDKINRVEYYIDGELFSTVSKSPYSLSRAITKTSNGTHTLSAYIFDDVDNAASANIEIDINLKDVTPSVSWLSPQTNTVYNLSDFPITLKAKIPNPENQRTGVTLLRFILNNRILATNVNPNTTNDITFDWKGPTSVGTYELYAQAQTKEDKKYSSEKITIIVK